MTRALAGRDGRVEGHGLGIFGGDGINPKREDRTEAEEENQKNQKQNKKKSKEENRNKARSMRAEQGVNGA